MIAEANRIFGYDGWDRTTVDARLRLERPARRAITKRLISPKCELRVRAGDVNIVREDQPSELALRLDRRASSRFSGLAARCVSACLKADEFALFASGSARAPHPARAEIDISALTIGEPKRIRCKEHLRFVANQPCLICGRSPAHAHHVRYAQSRGLSLKVSDEFTVPLCAIHHHHIHTTGQERDWWRERNIDPLVVARDLWRRSRERDPARREPDLSERLEDQAEGNK